MDHGLPPIKITRPLPAPGTIQRSRLYALMEESSQPIIWMKAPPGAGKTTLVSSYLEQAGLPCLWYQVDQGDADPASFFHYLGLAVKKAAPRVRRELPHLTPEYLPSLPVFTRHYFQVLYSRLKSPALLVFDNYQDVGTDAVLHTIMNNALTVLPEGIRVIILSRSEPPAALARLRASQTLSLLDWETVRLTAEESREIVQTRDPSLSAATIKRLYGQTQGWAAGLILALESGSCGSKDAFDAPQAVFDFFAEEIFRGMNEESQQILLQCAFLPRVDVSQAVELSGIPTAGHLLEDLNARGYFILKHAKTGYQFHPLFRAFLITRAEHSYDAAAMIHLRQRTAVLLEADGEIADAVELLINAGAWEKVAETVTRHAQVLLQQGRAQTVERWLLALPATFMTQQPKLQYWLGMCRLPVNPVKSRAHFEAAFSLFDAMSDMDGALLSWAAIVDTFVYDWGDFAPLDRWIAIMDARLAQQRRVSLPEIEARVSCGMFAALMWRQPQRQDLPYWAERVMHIVLVSDIVPLKMSLGNNAVLYFLWMGDFSKAAVIIDALRPYSHARDNDPLTQLHWWVMLAMYSWFVADHAGCLAAINEGEQLAENSGVHLLDLYLLAQGVYSGLSQNDPETAAMLLEKMSLIGSSRLMDKSLYHYQAASVHGHRRDFGLAYQHGQTSIELALATGTPLPVALTSVELAFTLFEQGNHAEARAVLVRGAEAGRGMKHIEFMNGLYTAHFALQSGERMEALATLRTTFALGAREGYVSTPRWNSAVVAPLCALALEHDIEVEYVRGLIRRRGLEPTTDTALVESWPWAVRIHTLGEFSVQVNEQPLATGRKSQQKQLTLLKVLTAIGPAGIGAGHLAAWLWPDADGDKAYHSLEMTIHRVRKLLGREDALLLTQGQVRLNTLVCWVDSNAFADYAAAALMSQTGTIELLERAVHLYRGHLLEYGDDAEPWVLSARDRLKAKYLSAVEKLCALYEASGEDEKALSLCRRSADVDELSEEIYRCYISSCLRLDRETEATDAFRRLERAMKAALGTTPSRKTAALLPTPL